MGITEKINWPVPGKYVVAVSGGVDSMSLLNLLAETDRGYELTVAHCNHGLRPDSGLDEELVKKTAQAYGLVFQTVRLSVSQNINEAGMRRKRYGFLCQKRKESQADAVITAHHLDDRLETMLMNKQRGSGWYGLSPLHETETIKRPLLEVSKQEIITYAREKGLKWREDYTNFDPEYTLRNYIRRKVDKKSLLAQLREYDEYRQNHLASLGPVYEKTVEDQGRTTFIHRSYLLELDAQTARDVLYLALRRYWDMLDIDRDAIYRLEHFCKTALPGKRLELSGSINAIAHGNRIEILARAGTR